MRSRTKAMLEKLGLREADFEPKKDAIVYISREDFNLMDALTDGTIYYVSENNGSMTIVKGENK